MAVARSLEEEMISSESFGREQKIIEILETKDAGLRVAKSTTNPTPDFGPNYTALPRHF